MKHLFSFAILFLFVLSSNAQPQIADRIYVNAKVWTGDADNHWASSIAIKGNKILFVGKDYSKYKSANTAIINVQGKTIVPGFIDNHTHFLSGGYQLASVNLRYAKTPAEFISILKTYVSARHDDRWI